MTEESADSQPIEMKFVYRKSADYKLHYANGIFGGFNAQGELICNFFFEARDLPKEQSATLQGTTLTFKDVQISREIIREFNCGIIMTPQQAYAMRDWLNGKLEEFEQKFGVRE